MNVAHGEDFSAFTITSATTPSKITMIASTAICAINPPRLLTSSRAISPSVFPSRRIEQNKIMKSCTHPAKAQPAISHKRSRQISELRRQRRPHQRSRPGNRREVMPEQHPFICRHKIAAIIQALRGSRARIVQRQNFCGNKCRVQPVGHQVAARPRRSQTTSR